MLIGNSEEYRSLLNAVILPLIDLALLNIPRLLGNFIVIVNKGLDDSK
jgi:hypothetical protein